MGKVAVITPTRNRSGTIDRPGFLEQCIYSVSAQDHGDYVHLIVDDGSEDMTPEMVDFYRSRDPRILYMRREKPEGERRTASFANNAGLRAVFDPGSADFDGAEMLEDVDYVTVHHSDDLLAPGSLRKRSEALDEGAGMVHGDMYIFFQCNGRGRIVRCSHASRKPPGKLYDDILCMKDEINNHTVMVTRDVAENAGFFDESISYGEDLDMSLRCMNACSETGLPLKAIPEPLAFYRVHGDSITAWANEEDFAMKESDSVLVKNGAIPFLVRLARVRHIIRHPHKHLPHSVKNRLRPLQYMLFPPEPESAEYMDMVCRHFSRFWDECGEIPEEFTDEDYFTALARENMP